jgi:diguanylate cyclase (GGDEF)-like protein
MTDHPQELDALTGSLTRPSFLARLEDATRRAGASGATLCVCLVDVDSLKSVNDRHGLQTGDTVLAALANRLRATLAEPGWHRMQHVLARYDGDALIVLAEPCELRAGEQLAEALRFHVAAAPLHASVGITVSIGVAQFRIGESIDELLARVERTLHVAKQFGRDRVEVAETPASKRARAYTKKLRD